MVLNDQNTMEAVLLVANAILCENRKTLYYARPSLVSEKMAKLQFSPDICEHAGIVAEKFKTLFLKYFVCDIVFNSSIYLSDEEISQLAVNIN